MINSRRLTSQGHERKQQLLDQAAELFAERGYTETRIIDIVDAAGVAKGLFYWYFDNKAALFHELVVQNGQRLRQAQAAAMNPEAEALLRIRQGAEASVRYMSRHAHYFSLLEMESVEREFSDVLRGQNDLHIRDAARLVKEGQGDGSIRDDDAFLLALGTVTTVGSYSQLLRCGRITSPVATVTSFVGRYIVCSLAADEQTAVRVLSAPAEDGAIAAPAASPAPG